MAKKVIVETIYGKRCKFEIEREDQMLGSAKFRIFRDGEYYKGSYSSLSAAVEAVEREG